MDKIIDEIDINAINPNDISICSFIDELALNLNKINSNIREYSIKHNKILVSFSIVLLKQIKYKMNLENELTTDSTGIILFKKRLGMVIDDILGNQSITKSQLYQFFQNLNNINYYVLIFKTFFEIKVKSHMITSHIVFKFTLQISRRSGVVLIENLSVMLYYEINRVLNKESINLNVALEKNKAFKMTLYNSTIDGFANTKCGCVSQDCYICKEKEIKPFDDFISKLNKITNYNDLFKETSILFYSNKLYSTINVKCSFCPELNNTPVFPELPIEKVSKLFFAKDSDHPCVFYACEKCYNMMTSTITILLCPNCSKFLVNFNLIQKYINNS